ncbi:MAG: rRNA cytosine-C5-methyltransferase [Prevotellaceae bacterium]|jgi:16S rRNA C967 or C1407 C5-methylase (RsmB/RsmF family)/NOL1/NOP2/fmu family ribosome biogenesis protein|nr:rRNA cytosine-C5-methyltransferase [Prevotellaceae bacterium]
MNLPEQFVEEMKSILGSEYPMFESALNEPAPVCLRLNEGVKLPPAGFDLPFAHLYAGEVAWCKSGKYLSERPPFARDPLFRAGSYYVQEAASMFAERCAETVRQHGGVRRVLDLCAAPGGKATHLASLFPDSLAVCNETIRSRAGTLEENMAKWGTPNAVVTSSDPAKFAALPSFFDFILVDAPCSGEGMFRKDPEAMKEWSPEHVKHCAARQKRILRDVWNALRPGGFLLYGTCTYNREENENTVRYIIENLGAAAVPVDPEFARTAGIAPSLDDSIDACRFYPHKTKSEGLFLALLRKCGESEPLPPTRWRKPKQSNAKDFGIRSWTHSSEELVCVRRNTEIFMMPEKFAGDIELVRQRLHVLSAGTEICAAKGTLLIPSHNFALSILLNRNNFTVREIDPPTALAYLSRETLPSFPNTDKGYVLLTHKNVAIGWVKDTGERCNNMMPRELRIKN